MTVTVSFWITTSGGGGGGLLGQGSCFFDKEILSWKGTIFKKKFLFYPLRFCLKFLWLNSAGNFLVKGTFSIKQFLFDEKVPFWITWSRGWGGGGGVEKELFSEKIPKHETVPFRELVPFYLLVSTKILPFSQHENIKQRSPHCLWGFEAGFAHPMG